MRHCFFHAKTLAAGWLQGPPRHRPMTMDMNARIDFGQPGIARYVQLGALFRRRIETGEWIVGERIPTLERLTSELGVARATIRQALGELEAEGLLRRGRATGKFGTRRAAAPYAVQLATDWASLLNAHQGDTIEVLATANVNRLPYPIDAPLRYAPGYHYLRRMHRRDGVPYLLGHVYLESGIFGRLPKKMLRTTPMLRLLKECKGVHIANAQQSLTIGAADVETAARLQVAINAPVAIVHRTAFDRAGTLIYYSFGIYRGDHLRLEMTLK